MSPTLTSDRICKQLTVCEPGTETVLNETRTSDRECQPCPAGFADEDLNPNSPCVLCPPGTYSNPDDFGRCSKCSAGSIDHDDDPTTPCEPCSPETFQPSVGKVVIKLVALRKSMFVESIIYVRKCCYWFNMYLPQVQCIDTSTCGYGLEESIPYTSTSDRKCRPCEDGSFKASKGQEEKCQPHKVCGPGFELESPGTQTRDAICEPCPDNTWKDSHSNSKCLEFSTCDSGEATTVPASKTNGRRGNYFIL